MKNVLWTISYLCMNTTVKCSFTEFCVSLIAGYLPHPSVCITVNSCTEGLMSQTPAQMNKWPRVITGNIIHTFKLLLI